MIRLILGVRRRPDVDPADFTTWWRTTYPQLLRAESHALAIHSFALSEPFRGNALDRLRERRGSAEPFDGIVEIRWLSRRELYSAGLSPEGVEADHRLIALEAAYVDLAHSVATLVEEELDSV